ncbi:DUF3291 domain-containing protein [Nonomuraea sp. NPDC049758]|uniref:DUF3291 domain-containing protein n=1 Tax=Nonomuraea sp. NPDC049758 TaxID=3154360 RepID=UPI003428646B
MPQQSRKEAVIVSGNELGQRFYLAQFNIASSRWPLGHSQMTEFTDLLEPLNQVAEDAPGFVWRPYTLVDGDIDFWPYGPDVVINYSVWESLEQLRDFVYRGRHREVFKRRAEWFTQRSGHWSALWWVKADSKLGTDECVNRLELLNRNGPSPCAFTFARSYPRPCICHPN